MTEHFPKRFRLQEIGNPQGQGHLNLYYLQFGLYEIDYGEEFERERGIFSVRMRDQVMSQLAEGNENQPEALRKLEKRIAYYVKQKLQSRLGQPTVEARQHFEIGESEVEELRKILPDKVEVNQWVDIERLKKKNQVFISCGQRNAEERKLGNSITQLVEELTPYRAYFAQNQGSLQSVTQNIFRALHESSGFIAVLHKRDRIEEGGQRFRGSVWVEQEIAIGAFVTQELGNVLPTIGFFEKGVQREGLREFILLNPREFTRNEEVLEVLEEWLPSISVIHTEGYE